MSYHPSYWERSVLLKPFDFIVLGAGIIGKQIAIKIKLKNPSARIALVDKYPISYGASTRNAGFACFGSISEILDDFSRSSEDQVIALAEKRYRGINQLVKEFGASAIGYRPTGSHEIFDHTQTEAKVEAMDALDRINGLMKEATGLTSIFKRATNSTFQFNALSDSIHNQYEGMLNSGLLNATVADKAHSMGIIPLYGFDVKSFEKISSGYRLYSAEGMTLDTNQLIIANNAFAGQLIPNIDVVPARGQIIVTHPIENLSFDGIFFSDKGYVYFRNIDDRVLIGGGRNHFYKEEETFDFEGSNQVKSYLENYLKTIVLPDQPFEIDMHWSGIMAMGAEKLPIVKRLDNHLLLCVRMSGMGVALGPVLSDEIAAMV
ncbi:MAG: FAD-dependent oxidoreductase [Bacteroidota bacterium]